MIDLRKQSGLPVSWRRSTERLVFEESLPAVEPAIRRREEMREVLYDPQASGADELYYMYRGIALPQDRALIAQHGLRYDITVIRPGVLGREYIKTAGHYHPARPGATVTYPEVYEVLYGRAHYLLQSHHPGMPERLGSVVLITAKPGDKVLIPPGYGHVTINPGDDFLIMSNWVAAEFSSLYEPYRRQSGAGYFELQAEEGPEFVPNKRYQNLPPLQRLPVTPLPGLNLITGLPIYRVFQINQRALEFLTHPEEQMVKFEEYLMLLNQK